MKLLKILGFICTGFLVVILLLLWALRPNQPSDQSLQKRFYKHRPDLDHLVEMMDEDWQMSRIARDFTWRQDNLAWPRPESEWGISRERWDDYRKLFSRAGFDDGTTRREKSSDVMVDVWSWGIVPSGVSVSYLHCGAPRNGYNHTERPCIDRKDSGSGMYSASYQYRYKKITEDWYIFEESN
jgi:hypothetical protein